MKPDFEKAQNTATKILLQQNITGFFIDVRTFSTANNIIIDSMQNFCKLTGFSLSNFKKNKMAGACLVKEDGCNIILYDDSMPNNARKHWGIAHELGHIVLDHTRDSRTEEIEAHFFAAQIVTPEIVLMEFAKRLGRLSATDLPYYFNISYEAACRRIGTLNRRCIYSSSQIDLQLLEKFSPLMHQITPHIYVS